MRDITFGQYYPTKSFVHNMDARVKILLTIAYVVAVFMVKQFMFGGFIACFVFVLFASLLARLPLSRVVGSIKGVIFIVIFSAVLQLFFNRTGKVIWWVITDVGLLNAGFIVCRILLIILGASLLTLTTTPVEIADGIESLLSPLKLLKIPVREFALIMSIALRFIPTLLNETDRIIKAQKARGADFESGNIFKRAKALIPVLIPLLISSFRRADELADAMDSRCYVGGNNRTKFKKMTITYKDVLGVILTAVLIAGVVYLNGFLMLGVVV